MPFLTLNKQHQSTEGKFTLKKSLIIAGSKTYDDRSNVFVEKKLCIVVYDPM